MPTKHYYIEGERICTKIGGGFGLVAPLPPLDTAGTNTISFAAQLWTMVRRGFECAGNKVNDISILPGFSAINNSNNLENYRYYYHPDHLGSSSFITNQSGNVIEHLQYMPYGENFISQRSGRYDTPYKFSGKEKDEETQYSYFGARYYDSDLSIWLSVDPLASKYPSLSPFAYCSDNPINRIDPTGASDDWFENEKTGDIYYNNKMKKGDESKLGVGWVHMGENEMFKKEGDDMSSDAYILMGNGGNPKYTKNDDGGYTIEGSFKGDAAKKFMESQGYNFNPVQQVLYSKLYTIKTNNAPRQPSLEIRITEKSRYMESDFYESGWGYISNPKIKTNLTSTETIGRTQVNYSSNIFGGSYLKILSIFYPSFPIIYDSWSQYTNNVEFINEFEKKHGKQ